MVKSVVAKALKAIEKGLNLTGLGQLGAESMEGGGTWA